MVAACSHVMQGSIFCPNEDADDKKNKMAGNRKSEKDDLQLFMGYHFAGIPHVINKKFAI